MNYDTGNILINRNQRETNKMSDYENTIYVACLAAYNDGILYGRQIEVENKTQDEILEEIQEMLKASPANQPNYPCEEWAIHDSDLPFSVSEYESIDKIVRQLELYNEHGDAWTAYCDWIGSEYATEEHFEESYQGSYDSELDYAYDYIDNTGMLDDVPECIESYFDYELFARDLFMSDVHMEDGHVFTNC